MGEQAGDYLDRLPTPDPAQEDSLLVLGGQCAAVAHRQHQEVALHLLAVSAPQQHGFPLRAQHRLGARGRHDRDAVEESGEGVDLDHVVRDLAHDVHLETALARLRAQTGVRVVTCSQVYETTPWPEVGSPRATWHLNCAVEIETDLPPRRLLRLIQVIEGESGRLPQGGSPGPSSPRSLDIDILLYADQVIAEDRLQIPHPFLHLRRFVLVPLADIAPQVAACL